MEATSYEYHSGRMCKRCGEKEILTHDLRVKYCGDECRKAALKDQTKSAVAAWRKRRLKLPAPSELVQQIMHTDDTER